MNQSERFPQNQVVQFKIVSVKRERRIDGFTTIAFKPIVDGVEEDVTLNKRLTHKQSNDKAEVRLHLHTEYLRYKEKKEKKAVIEEGMII